jgi:hypothetical protein
LEVQTKLLKVPVSLVAPPVAGTPTPDYYTQPRALRVTGTFHSEINNSHLVKNILQYLIERYTVLPYNSEYFLLNEITAELDAIPDVIGMYIDKPTDVYKVIARLQTGCRMGFKFYTYGGKYTARVHNPNRAVRFHIRQYDIKNLYSLELDMNGDDYISDGYVRYAKNYSEDTWNEYRNEDTHARIVAERGADIAGGADTLMAHESGAIMRYNNFMRDSIALSYTVSGVKLNEKRFSEFRQLREYDICDIDFGILTNVRRWYIMKIEIDFFMESVTVDARSV